MVVLYLDKYASHIPAVSVAIGLLMMKRMSLVRIQTSLKIQTSKMEQRYCTLRVMRVMTRVMRVMTRVMMTRIEVS